MAKVLISKPNGKTPVFDIKTGQYFLGVGDRIHIRTVGGSTRLDDGNTFSTGELVPYAHFEVLTTGTNFSVTI